MSVERSYGPAFMLAVPAAVALWMGAFFTYTLVMDGIVRAAQLAPYILIGGVLFGLPIAAAAVACLAVPAFLLLRRLSAVTRGSALAAGAVVGVSAREAIRHALAQPELGFVPLPVVLLTGLGAAALWWRTSNRPRPLRTAPPGLL